jgi:hypothetical protein
MKNLILLKRKPLTKKEFVEKIKEIKKLPIKPKKKAV